jgi:hypothetical protein
LRTDSVLEDDGSVTVSIKWYQEDILDTGGVPLTGFKLYQFEQDSYYEPEEFTIDDADAVLAFDGSDLPASTSTDVTGLTADTAYSFRVTALNPDESVPSEMLTVHAGGFPDAPDTISEIAGSRTGHSIGLDWDEPANTGGSAIISYTLAIFWENEPYEVVYHGTETEEVVEGLTAGETYHFMIKATTLIGDSEWSSN